MGGSIMGIAVIYVNVLFPGFYFGKLAYPLQRIHIKRPKGPDYTVLGNKVGVGYDYVGTTNC